MLADYMKWLRWVGLYTVFLAFPVLLIILGSMNSDLVPGIIIGITAYYAYSLFRREKGNAGEKKTI